MSVIPASAKARQRESSRKFDDGIYGWIPAQRFARRE
jgi:hypothetical protein